MSVNAMGIKNPLWDIVDDAVKQEHLAEHYFPHADCPLCDCSVAVQAIMQKYKLGV